MDTSKNFATNWADVDDDDDFAGDHERLEDGTEILTKYAQQDGNTVKTVTKLKSDVNRQWVNLAVERRKAWQTWGDKDATRDVPTKEKEVFHIMPPRALASGVDEEEPQEPAPSVMLNHLFKRVHSSLLPASQAVDSMEKPLDHPHDLKQAEFKLRVTNLSETVTTAALRELFASAVSTGYDGTPDVFMPINRQTELPRGFAFITFKHREHAEKAIRVLDRHGFNNFVLGVEWAKPPRPR